MKLLCLSFFYLVSMSQDSEDTLQLWKFARFSTCKRRAWRFVFSIKLCKGNPPLRVLLPFQLQRYDFSFVFQHSLQEKVSNKIKNTRHSSPTLYKAMNTSRIQGWRVGDESSGTHHPFKSPIIKGFKPVGDEWRVKWKFILFKFCQSAYMPT